MKASVIIPTRNRANVLGACLESLTQQTLPIDQFEVVVVDNGSTDGTRQVAARYASEIDVRVEHAPEPGLHVGRHAGLRAARSDVLVFADDDIVAGRAWLAAIVDAFSSKDVALVGGNNLPLFEQQPPAWLQRLWERPMARGRALPSLSILDFGKGRFEIDPHFVWGCNFSIRRDILLAAGGFHPDAMPQEHLRWRGDGESHVSEWIRHSRYRTVFDGDASVQHRVPSSRMTGDYFARRAFAQGVSDSFTDIRRARRPAARVPTRLRHFLRGAYQAAMLKFRRPIDGVDADLISVRHGMLDGWRRGYAFHASEVRSDANLFAWVTKETYL